MKTLLALVALMLPSCGLFGSENTFAIPVSQAEQLGQWTADNAAGFDYDGDDYLTDSEFGTFLGWFAGEILATWPAPVPEAPITESAKVEAAREKAKAEGQPLPK